MKAYLVTPYVAVAANGAPAYDTLPGQLYYPGPPGQPWKPWPLEFDPKPNDPTRADNHLMYGFNEAIALHVQHILGGIPVFRVPYMPMQPTDDNEHDPSDKNVQTVRGKILVQYQPARRDCPESGAAYRIWFENKFPERGEHVVWKPSEDQIFEDDLLGDKKMAKTGACTVPFETANFTSVANTGPTEAPNMSVLPITTVLPSDWWSITDKATTVPPTPITMPTTWPTWATSVTWSSMTH